MEKVKLELTSHEAWVLNSVLMNMISGEDTGPRGEIAKVIDKLISAGVGWGIVEWYLNEFNNIHIERIIK